MKESDRTWIVLAALALVVAALYYLLEVRGIASKSDDVDYVWELQAEEVVAIRVVDNGAEAATAVEKGADGMWMVTEPAPALARTADCDSLAYTLAQMQVRRTIEEPPQEELGAYGLITPTYTIEMRVSDGQTLRLEVGNEGLGASYFVRREGEQAVLLVPAYAIDAAIAIVESPPLAEAPILPGAPILGPTEEAP